MRQVCRSFPQFSASSLHARPTRRSPTETRPTKPSRPALQSSPDLLFRPHFPARRPAQKPPFGGNFQKSCREFGASSTLPFYHHHIFPKIASKKRPEIYFFPSFSAFFSPFWLLFHPPFGPRFARFAALFCFASRHLFAHRPARGPKARVAPSAPPICASPGAPKLRQFAPVLPLHNRVSRGSAPNFVASSLFFIRLQRAQVCR